MKDWRDSAHSWGLWRREDGSYVELWRRGQQCRFYDGDGQQVGPEHRNVVPAIVWAYHETEWVDSDAPAWLDAGVRREVRAKSTVRR